MKTAAKIIGCCIVAGAGSLAGNYQVISETVNIFPETLEQRIVPPVAQLLCGGRTDPQEVAEYVIDISYDDNNKRMKEFIQELSPNTRKDFVYGGFSELPYEQKLSTIERMEEIYEGRK